MLREPKSGNMGHKAEPTLRTLLGVTLWWLPFNIFWSILLVHGLQIRIEGLVEEWVVGRALGWLNFIGALVSTLTQLVVGPISDTLPWSAIRRRLPLIMGTLFAFFPVYLFLHTGRFDVLVLNFALLQFAINCAAASFQALIPDILPGSKHGIASAYMAMWALIGNLAGMAICIVFLGRISVHATELALSAIIFCSWLLLFIVAILTAVLIKESAREAERKTTRFIGQILSAMNFKDVIGHRSFMWLFASRFLIQMGVYGSIPFLRWYVRDTLFSEKVVFDTAIIGICAICGSAISIFPAGKLADKYSKRMIIFFSCSIAIFGGIIFVCANSKVLAMIAAAILGAGFGAFSAVDWALACNLVPREWAAKFMAVFHIAFTLPQATSSFIGGFVGDFGNQVLGKGVGWRLVFVMCVIYFAIGSWMIRNVRERQENQNGG
ncbi:MAG: MFS transporter [Armatimonadota bacterium]|nr:MFS transporter [Armatimonadota bacterium]MCX7777384.1 MFS transporter [Armatimonadota bacterium]MDW8025348.1 MFS transporter [Armatimonadota bacterium]